MSQPSPAGVSDPVLWRLATDVAAHHQPGPARRCAHPFCAGAAWPCDPYRLARYAGQAARRPPSPAVHSGQAAPVLPRRTPSWVAIPGHADAAAPLSRTESAVLSALGATPATATDLAGRTRLHPAEVARVLDRLAALRLAAPLSRALPPRGGASRMSPPPYRRV